MGMKAAKRPKVQEAWEMNIGLSILHPNLGMIIPLTASIIGIVSFTQLRY